MRVKPEKNPYIAEYMIDVYNPDPIEKVIRLLDTPWLGQFGKEKSHPENWSFQGKIFQSEKS